MKRDKEVDTGVELKRGEYVIRFGGIYMRGRKGQSVSRHCTKSKV